MPCGIKKKSIQLSSYVYVLLVTIDVYTNIKWIPTSIRI